MQQDTMFNSESEHPQEGGFTKAIEKQTAKLPSISYLVMACGAIAASLGLAITQKNKGLANFIGLWVPSLMLIGIYNKLVKLQGSDQETPVLH